MGEAIVAYRGYQPYWGNHFTASASDAAAEDFILSRHEAFVGSNDPYNYGSLATEYIVASVGIEPLMNIWKLAGEGASFEDAFEEALGISVQDFYAAYDAMVVNMVMG
jgi:ABC-type phosphate/phosphonate transport system substrate-binding protein